MAILELVREFIDGWMIVGQAWPQFLILTLVVGVLLHWAFRWRYSGQIEQKNTALDAKDSIIALRDTQLGVAKSDLDHLRSKLDDLEAAISIDNAPARKALVSARDITADATSSLIMVPPVDAETMKQWRLTIKEMRASNKTSRANDSKDSG